MKTKPMYVVLFVIVLTALVGAGCLSGEQTQTGGRDDEKQQTGREVPTDRIIGKWSLVPSQEQVDFARSMGKTAGPLVYEFNADGTYTCVGGPLGPREYKEHGEFTFDGPTLTFRRKGVEGDSSPAYEQTTSNRVELSEDGSVLTGPSDFGGWSFQGNVRFEKQ